MIWSIITDLLAPFWPYIAGALAIVGGWFVARRSGVQSQKAKQAEAVAKGVEAGAKGAAQAEADLRAGKTPQQVKEANDAHWR